MTLGETLISVWQQALGDGREDIELEGETYPVTVSKAKGLRMVEFNVGPYRIVGIEQPQDRVTLGRAGARRQPDHAIQVQRAIRG